MIWQDRGQTAFARAGQYEASILRVEYVSGWSWSVIERYRNGRSWQLARGAKPTLELAKEECEYHVQRRLRVEEAYR